MPSSTSPHDSTAEPSLDHLLESGELRHGHQRLRGAAAGMPAVRAGCEGPERQQKPATPEHPGPALTSPLLERFRVPHGFSVRTGGASTVYGPDELNLGFTASDTRENVLENRGRLLRHAFGAGRPLATLRQRHTTLLHAVEEAETDRIGDALMTDRPGIALGVQTADCVPVLIAAKDAGVVAAFHAGWRGTLRRIVECGVGRMRLQYGLQPSDLVAAIGPSIRACCYAVGEEVEAEFSAQFSYTESLFFDVYDTDPVRKKYPMLFLTQRAPGHSNLGPSRHLDLAEANRRQLLGAGLNAESIEVLPFCTSCCNDLFFSHRADAGFTGRMLNVIGTAEL